MTKNDKIRSAAEEIIDLLELLIPEHADSVEKKLKDLLAKSRKQPDDHELVTDIVDLLSDYPKTKKWMRNKLSEEVTRGHYRGGGSFGDSYEPPNPAVDESGFTAEELDEAPPPIEVMDSNDFSFSAEALDETPPPLEDSPVEVMSDGVEKSVKPNEDEDAPHIYPVWFGTNREPNDKNDFSKGFSNDRAKDFGAVYYGKCKVSVPKTHRFGETGRSWLRRWATLDFNGDDNLRIETIMSCKDAAEFWQRLSTSFQNNAEDQRDAVVFLHGYNNSFEDAAIRAAQIGFDLKVQGHTAFFSWPSKDAVKEYMTDESSIKASETAITDFLVNFVEKSGASKVHLIAHSMGNRGLLAALENIQTRIKLGEVSVKFGQIILAAPDLDVDVFRRAKAAYSELSESTTVYTSKTDKAVAASHWLHSYPRLGKLPPIIVEDGIDTVTVTRKAGIFELGHGYFAEAEALLNDMFDLIRHGQPPHKRQRPNKKTNDNGEVYWEIKSAQ